VDFSVIAGNLYKMEMDEVLQRYVANYERQSILTEAHGGFVVGHYARRETTQKILCIGLWWPNVHKDSKEYCRACDVTQRIRKSL